MAVASDWEPGSNFFWIGNDLSVDFANTAVVAGGQPVELLGTFADLIAWAGEGDVLTAAEQRAISGRVGAGAGDALIRDARAFRDALRSLFDAVVRDVEPPAVAIASLNARLRAGGGGVAEVRREGGTFVRVPDRPPLDERTVPRRVAEAAAALLTTRDLSLLKKCQGPTCVLFFFDTTKNHARRWCSMEGCGNRHKAAAHYRRRRST